MFQRSASKIQHLKLDFDDVNLSEWDVLELPPFLKVIPNITHLEISLHDYYYNEDHKGDGFLTRLFLRDLWVGPSSESPALLPKLSHLFVYDDTQWKWNLNMVESTLRVLESRSSFGLAKRADVAPLSAFHVVYCNASFTGRRCDGHNIPGLLELVREHEVGHGMRCRIAPATWGVHDADDRDRFDPAWWMELDGQLK
ncbi:hypothetical protein L218DRAFT_1004196 [Marasmius fiardii PR-910]|nr:hypothetical protein L218DRAFT_1004196 [Marasmius fiardii PR-910]